MKAAYDEIAKTYQPEPLPKLPRGVVGMTSEELAARKARIDEWNRRWKEEVARTSLYASSERGFNLPDEVQV